MTSPRFGRAVEAVDIARYPYVYLAGFDAQMATVANLDDLTRREMYAEVLKIRRYLNEGHVGAAPGLLDQMRWAARRGVLPLELVHVEEGAAISAFLGE
jgi:hypothetical protein